MSCPRAASWASGVLLLLAACSPVAESPDAPPGTWTRTEAEARAEPDRGCGDGTVPAEELYTAKVKPRYSEGFRVTYHGHYKRLEVGPPAAPAASFVLLRCGTPAPPDLGGATLVVVPVRSLATTSTTELPHLEALDVVDRWVGHADRRFVSSRALRQRIEAGGVAEIGGSDGLGLDVERLLELRADLLLVDNPERSGADRLQLMAEVGTAVAPIPAYLETSPLGRSEWILFTALFFDREARAAEVFGQIEESYLELGERVAAGLGEAPRPSVLTGGPWQGMWHVPGGESYLALLLADAGADYPWADVPSPQSLGLDLERVFEHAGEADFWLYPSHWRSLDEIVAVDERLAGFAAFREQRIYAADLRLSADGGNDFWELGAFRPDLLLADLVAIFHPRLLPDHQQVFHRRLTRQPP